MAPRPRPSISQRNVSVPSQVVAAPPRGVTVTRSTVLIDPQGRVAHHWRNVKAAGHAEKVRQKLEELQG